MNIDAVTTETANVFLVLSYRPRSLKQTTNNATDNEQAIIFCSRKALMLPFKVFREKMLISCKACYLIPLCIYCVNLDMYWFT